MKTAPSKANQDWVQVRSTVMPEDENYWFPSPNSAVEFLFEYWASMENISDPDSVKYRMKFLSFQMPVLTTYTFTESYRLWVWLILVCDLDIILVSHQGFEMARTSRFKINQDIVQWNVAHAVFILGLSI